MLISETCKYFQNLARLTVLPSSLLLNVREEMIGVGGGGPECEVRERA